MLTLTLTVSLRNSGAHGWGHLLKGCTVCTSTDANCQGQVAPSARVICARSMPPGSMGVQHTYRRQSLT